MSGSRRALLCPLLVAVLLGLVPARAAADGDPASDVLVSAPPLFLTAGSGASYRQERALVEQLRRAARRGRPLRVAVIADRSDLGSVTALWGQPQAYARFLGRELSLAYHGELLVVMPAGFGVVRDGVPARTPLAGLAPRGGRLVLATEQAIGRLTGAAPGEVTGPVAAGPSRIGGVGWWVTSVVALAVLVAVWTVSLRRVPVIGLRRSHR